MRKMPRAPGGRRGAGTPQRLVPEVWPVGCLTTFTLWEGILNQQRRAVTAIQSPALMGPRGKEVRMEIAWHEDILPPGPAVVTA